MIGELSQKQIAEDIAAEKRGGSRQKTLMETKRWPSVSKVYSDLNDEEMDMLNQAMLIYSNESKLVNSSDVKGAARDTIKLFRKWYVDRLDDMLPSIQKALMKEIAAEKKAE